MNTLQKLIVEIIRECMEKGISPSEVREKIHTSMELAFAIVNEQVSGNR